MNDPEQPTVFIVDDDAAVRDSISELVESIGLRCESFALAGEFLRAFRAERPGCLVLDVRMPEMSGLALQRKINEVGATLPIIVITGHGDVPIAVEAMKAGAMDFLQKPYREQALLDSINAALILDASTRESLLVGDKFEQSLSTLTAREREVFDFLLQGESNKEIASVLAISPRTVEAHRHNLLRKFGLNSVVELIRTHASRAGNK